MPKVKIEKELEKELEKEAQIKSLKSENDVWYFDSDEEFEKFAIASKRGSEEYTSGYEFAVKTGKVFVVMGGNYKSSVNRRGCAGNQPVQNLCESWGHFYHITL